LDEERRKRTSSGAKHKHFAKAKGFSFDIIWIMGRKNYLVEGVSGTGKSSVYQELRKRGYDAIDGDNELAYQGDPLTGEPRDGRTHENHIWDVEKVKRHIADKSNMATFLCGGSRNFSEVINLLDGVFVLEVDANTLNSRLDNRPENWGERKSERELILKLHQTKEDLPSTGIVIDATQPLEQVVDEIIKQTGA
jgi:broad-specificity NMP kinase